MAMFENKSLNSDTYVCFIFLDYGNILISYSDDFPVAKDILGAAQQFAAEYLWLG